MTEQEKDKINLIKINYNLKSNQEVFKFLVSEYKIRVDDQGFNDKKEKEYFK
jgi:hypothetical protein